MSTTRRTFVASLAFVSEALVATRYVDAQAATERPEKKMAPTSSATQLAQEHLHYLQTEVSKWGTLICDDMTWEFPFAAADQPKRYRGRQQVIALVNGFLASVKDLRFTDFKTHRLADEDAVFAEFSGESIVIANGRKYTNDYAFYLRAVDGRISLIREYIDPIRSMKAFA